MLRRRHREWLALTTVVVVVGACELNPQPDLPNNQGSSPDTGGSGGSLGVGFGGMTSAPGISDAGAGDSRGGNAGQIPEVNGGQSADAGAGGQSGGGDSGGQAVDSAAGQSGAAGGDAG